MSCNGKHEVSHWWDEAADRLKIKVRILGDGDSPKRGVIVNIPEERLYDVAEAAEYPQVDIPWLEYLGPVLSSLRGCIPEIVELAEHHIQDNDVLGADANRVLDALKDCDIEGILGGVSMTEDQRVAWLRAYRENEVT